MRRGLISWSQDEVPAEVLEGRVARLQDGIRTAGLDVLLVYCSFARPAAVSYLTHFVPYWNEALLVIFPGEAPLLLAAFSRRVHSWIQAVSHLGTVLAAPHPGRAAAALLEDRVAGFRKGTSRVGVLELDALPWAVAEPIVKAASMQTLIDATELFIAIRQPADAAETQLTRRAADIAAEALGAIPADVERATEVLSAVERSARRAGAEEVIMRLAPSLAVNSVLRGMENDAILGDRYAIELSVAYKAAWIRTTRCLARSAPPESWRAAGQWFDRARFRVSDAGMLAGDSQPVTGPPLAGTNPPRAAALTRTCDTLPGELASWTIEASVGSTPLAVVACDGPKLLRRLPAGTMAVLSLQLALSDGPWHASGPVRVAEDGSYVPFAR